MKKQRLDQEFENVSKLLCSITDADQMARLLGELLTETEIHDISLRLALLELLSEGVSQRDIAAALGISLCKITRGSKLLNDSNSEIYRIFISDLDA